MTEPRATAYRFDDQHTHALFAGGVGLTSCGKRPHARFTLDQPGRDNITCPECLEALARADLVVDAPSDLVVEIRPDTSKLDDALARAAGRFLLDADLDVGLAANERDRRSFALWRGARTFVVDDLLAYRLRGEVVRNVYVTEFARDRLTPQRRAEVREHQSRHYPHGVIRPWFPY